MTYSFTVTAPAFFAVMLTMIAVGAALALWVVRGRPRAVGRAHKPNPSLRVALRLEDADTADCDLAMLVEACRAPGDGEP